MSLWHVAGSEDEDYITFLTALETSIPKVTLSVQGTNNETNLYFYSRQFLASSFF